MKAISLIQPWASLVILGAKRYETRGWKTSFRGPLYIHASKKFAATAMAMAADEPFASALGHTVALPSGVLLGVVEVVECCRVESVSSHGAYAWPVDAAGKAVEGQCRDIFDAELAFGDFRPGRWAWELKVLEKFEKPIPIAGHLGLWEVPEGVAPVLTFMQPAGPPEALFPADGPYLEGR